MPQEKKYPWLRIMGTCKEQFINMNKDHLLHYRNLNHFQETSALMKLQKGIDHTNIHRMYMFLPIIM